MRESERALPSPEHASAVVGEEEGGVVGAQHSQPVERHLKRASTQVLIKSGPRGLVIGLGVPLLLRNGFHHCPIPSIYKRGTTENWV